MIDKVIKEYIGRINKEVDKILNGQKKEYKGREKYFDEGQQDSKTGRVIDLLRVIPSSIPSNPYGPQDYMHQQLP